MSELVDRELDQYLRGELSPAEARKLAESALANDELFDSLAAHGAVEQALQDPEFRAALDASGRVRHLPRKASSRRTWGLALVAAAAVALLSLFVGSRRQPQPKQPIAVSAPPAPASKPTLIAKDFSPAGGDPVFRSATSETRAPQPEGVIVATDNFLVTINLGSLDGLVKGTQLDVYAAGSKRPTGRLEATTIFRDRSRARIVSGSSVQEHDRVRPEPSVYLRAVLDVMDSNRKLGHDALTWAVSTGATPVETRSILERVAPLDYQAGDIPAAEQDYKLLLASAAMPSDRAEAQNNLGATAELRGDQAAARAFYQDALRTLGDSQTSSTPDRQIIEANLARLAGGAVEKH
jgi:hypothetical protein